MNVMKPEVGFYYRWLLPFGDRCLIVAPGISIELPEAEIDWFSHRRPNALPDFYSQYFNQFSDGGHHFQDVLKARWMEIVRFIRALDKNKDFPENLPQVIAFDYVTPNQINTCVFSSNGSDYFHKKKTIFFLAHSLLLAISGKGEKNIFWENQFREFWRHTPNSHLFNVGQSFCWPGNETVKTAKILDSTRRADKPFPLYNIVESDPTDGSNHKEWQIDFCEQYFFNLHALATAAFLMNYYALPYRPAA